MAVEYLNINGIVDKYTTKHFYIAHFTKSKPQSEKPYSDRPPYRARLKWNSYELNPDIYLYSNEYGEEHITNTVYKFIVSDNLEELQELYNKLKCEWISERKNYLESQLTHITKLKNELMENK